MRKSLYVWSRKDTEKMMGLRWALLVQGVLTGLVFLMFSREHGFTTLLRLGLVCSAGLLGLAAWGWWLALREGRTRTEGPDDLA